MKMRMILKNKTKTKLNINWINKKTYSIFLISLFIISIITGIIFFILLNSNNKEEIINNVNSYFTLNDSYNYLSILFDNIKSNFLNCILIWFLGISVIGSVIILFLYFLEGFSLGISIAALFSLYKYKAIIVSFLYFFPSKTIYILLMFILTFFSISFSYKIIKSIIVKEENKLHDDFIKYLKKLVICLILFLLCSFFETFIDPLMIKIFTFLIK